MELAVADGFTLALTQLSSSYALSHTLELTHPASGVASSTVLLHRSNVLWGSSPSRHRHDHRRGGVRQRASPTPPPRPSPTGPLRGDLDWSDVTTTGRLTELANRQLIWAAPRRSCQLRSSSATSSPPSPTSSCGSSSRARPRRRVPSDGHPTQLADSIAVTSLTLQMGLLLTMKPAELVADIDRRVRALERTRAALAAVSWHHAAGWRHHDRHAGAGGRSALA